MVSPLLQTWLPEVECMDELVCRRLLYSRPMKGRWVIDCAVEVARVSMTHAATEPWSISRSMAAPEVGCKR